MVGNRPERDLPPTKSRLCREKLCVGNVKSCWLSMDRFADGVKLDDFNWYGITLGSVDGKPGNWRIGN